jgi:hypothetical protein
MELGFNRRRSFSSYDLWRQPPRHSSAAIDHSWVISDRTTASSF